MSLKEKLKKRSESKCELCSNTEGLDIYEVLPEKQGVENSIYICSTCQEQIEKPEKPNINHWRCLNDSMWSETLAVQVMAWRMLTRYSSEGWTQALLEMLYLDQESLKWAKATGEGEQQEEVIVHKDTNGVILQAGDSVVLIKDLSVKGANFTAKRGTAVRRISLVHDNPGHIEGKVNGQQIVILTEFVKKT